jgi:polygalacturonase
MRHTLGILMLVALGGSILSNSAVAQQPGLSVGGCSNVRVGNMTFMRCQGQSTRDPLAPKSGGTTDPAAAGKPYGGWGSNFGGQRWQSLGN